MKIYGLIGKPLSHSLSAEYFSQKFLREKITGTVYKSFPLENINYLPTLIKEQPDLKGLNVTIPYKQSVIPFLDDIDKEAEAVGAINTIKFLYSQKGEKLKGFNTDIAGFEHSLKPLLNPNINKSLVLGTGGASRAVTHVLKKLDISFYLVSRNPTGTGQIGYREIDQSIMRNYKLIINTTPLGMYPYHDQFPEIPYEHLTSGHLLYDLIYSPSETLFLQKGQKMNAAIKNGMEMFHIQAEASWKIWKE